MSGLLAEIESLTRRMQDCAERQEWSEVAALLTRRDALARRAEPSELAGSLERLLAETQEVLELARAARSRVAAELRRLEEGRRAVSAYGGAQADDTRQRIAAREEMEKKAASA